MRVGYLGPEGTFSHEALMAEVDRGGLHGAEPVPLPTVYDTVMAVQKGDVERALVPIENSLEGSVNATLDALAIEADGVVVVGEVVHPIHHCLIARRQLELAAVETVVSHPQATAQCARFIRERLPNAQVLVGSSTAEAVRLVAEQDRPWAALGNRLAAERYGCRVLAANLEDVPGNRTRFVWVAPAAGAELPAGDSSSRPWKTAIVFWGAGSDAPGWLVGCLGEFASRQVNLTRIESRPLKQELGQYMFFVDLEGGLGEARVQAALEAVGEQVQTLRMLGSFPAA
jgi:prephenate dehydratase